MRRPLSPSALRPLRPGPQRAEPLRIGARRALVLALAGLAGLGFAGFAGLGCASTGPEIGGQPVRVRLVEFRSGMPLELVGESHTDRVELYSQRRRSATTKVQTDDVMEGLVEFFHDQGFFEHAQEGELPPGAGGPSGLYSMVLTLEIGDDVRCMGLARSSGPEQRAAFEACYRGFVDLYNQTYQLQSVEQADFSNPASKRPTRR